MAERTRRRDRSVVLRREELEAVAEAAALQLGLWADLEQVELVALLWRLPRLERELELDRTAEARGAEAQEEGERLRERNFAAT